MTSLGVMALFSVVAVVALRWFFADRREARAHELAVHASRVTVDQEALDKAMANVKRLEERVKTLEYRPK